MFKLEKENEILRRRVANSETSVAAGNDTQEIEGLRLELVDKRYMYSIYMYMYFMTKL